MWDAPFRNGGEFVTFPEIEGLGFFLDTIEFNGFELNVKLSMPKPDNEVGARECATAHIFSRPLYFSVIDEYSDDVIINLDQRGFSAWEIIERSTSELIDKQRYRGIQAYRFDATSQYVCIIDIERPIVVVREGG